MAEKRKVGRPKFQIDYVAVEKLANIQCTQQEIATFLGCSTDTLQRDEQFCTLYKKGQENGKMSLRRIQFDLAKRNTSMAIFLGKQYLGQRDDPVFSDDESLNNVKNILVSIKETAYGTDGNKDK